MKINKLLCGIAVISALAFNNITVRAERAGIDNISSHEAAGSYYSYPYLDETPPAQTPVPAGYEPFHLEHYGRHGSRWHIGYSDFDKSYEFLNKAHQQHKLTPPGERTFAVVSKIRDDARQGRSGELSDIGARQHQAIGKRMVENFPEIFNSKTYIDARSTVVIRSILSMFNALDAIRSEVPDLHIKTDASAADMYYMNYDDPEAKALRLHADTTALRQFNLAHTCKPDYLKTLFNDSVWAADSVGSELYKPLIKVLLNTQSHSDQPWLVDSVFSPEEIKCYWLQRNALWSTRGGNSKITDNRMPFSQANLLNNIIASADSTLTSSTPSANLRYGHDTVVLPLAVLMELDNFGEEINDLEQLAQRGWHDYLMVPMAGNIQMIFYRKNGSSSPDDVLVKVLLNEREATLPVDSDLKPYYRWSDVRDYYLKKIAPYISTNNYQ